MGWFCMANSVALRGMRMSEQVISYTFTCACCCSLWQGVSGAEGRWTRPREAVRHEGAEEGHNHSEDKDDRTHAHRETGSGGYQRGPLSHHPPLRIPDRRQAAPDPRYRMTHRHTAEHRVRGGPGWQWSILHMG